MSAPSFRRVHPYSIYANPLFPFFLLYSVSPARRENQHAASLNSKGCSRRCHWQPIKLRKTLLIPFRRNLPGISPDQPSYWANLLRMIGTVRIAKNISAKMTFLCRKSSTVEKVKKFFYKCIPECFSKYLSFFYLKYLPLMCIKIYVYYQLIQIE